MQFQALAPWVKTSTFRRFLCDRCIYYKLRGFGLHNREVGRGHPQRRGRPDIQRSCRPFLYSSSSRTCPFTLLQAEKSCGDLSRGFSHASDTKCMVSFSDSLTQLGVLE